MRGRTKGENAESTKEGVSMNSEREGALTSRAKERWEVRESYVHRGDKASSVEVRSFYVRGESLVATLGETGRRHRGSFGTGLLFEVRLEGGKTTSDVRVHLFCREGRKRGSVSQERFLETNDDGKTKSEGPPLYFFKASFSSS